MTSLLAAAALILLAQERIEDNAWLRYKPGTWVKSKVTVVAPDRTIEDVQTLTLKEVQGEEFVVEESYGASGSKPSRSRRCRGVTVGTETLTIADRPYECTVSLVKGTNEQGPTESRFWTPVGGRNAVKIAFKQKDTVGELLATAVDEKVTALGKELVCNRLKGKVKSGEVEGSLCLLLCEAIPGAQVSADLVLKGPRGDIKIRFEAQNMHEEK